MTRSAASASSKRVADDDGHTRKKSRKVEDFVVAERGLIVVAGSHKGVAYDDLMRQNNHSKKAPSTQKKAGKAHFCLLGRDEAVERQARQLMLRPTSAQPLPYHSVLMLWNSRLLHQGGMPLAARQRAAAHTSRVRPFLPECVRPRLFEMEDSEEWQAHLEREGYVAIKNPLPRRDVHEALQLLLSDILAFSPALPAETRTLGEVRKEHFPPMFNGMTPALGMPHGKFAWYLRSRPQIHRVFGMLYPGQLLTGSVDLVMLSPPDCSPPAKATIHSHQQWLHVDQNSSDVCGDKRMYQSVINLFSKDTLQWGRIALPICMAPRDHHTVNGRDGEHSLLAHCIAGTASTHWPQLGISHRQGRITMGMRLQGVAHKFAQLRVELSPRLSRRRARELVALTHGQLCKAYSAEELREFVHPRARQFVSDGVRPP